MDFKNINLSVLPELVQMESYKDLETLEVVVKRYYLKE